MIAVGIVYLSFAALVLYGIQIRGTLAEGKYPTGEMNLLRGLFALEIIVGHCVRQETGLLLPLGKFMIVSVAFYFFVSGYGLARSFSKKGTAYLKGFLVRKCGSLLLLALTAYVWRFVLLHAVTYFDPERQFGYNLFEEVNWYIWCQLLYYVVFCLCYRFCRKRALPCVAALVLLQCLICYALGAAPAWYTSAIGFPAGILFWEKADRVDRFMSRWYGWVLTAVLTAVGLCTLVYQANTLLDAFVMRNALCIGVLMLLYLCLNYVRIDNKALRFFASYSAELYIFQFVYLEIFAEIPNPWRIVWVVGATFVTALAMHPLLSRAKKRF